MDKAKQFKVLLLAIQVAEPNAAVPLHLHPPYFCQGKQLEDD